MSKSVEEYMKLPYTRVIKSCYDNGEIYYYGRIDKPVPEPQMHDN